MANLIYDTFIIKDKYHTNSTDLNNLTNLYLPLMGIDSYSLYFVLSNLEQDKEYAYKMLLDLLPKLNLKDLNLALNKLEAMGLLKTYSKKDEPYFYLLVSPLSKDEFLGDVLLRQLLVSAIGEAEVKKLEQKEDYEGYKDITHHFDEVFSISTSSFEKSVKRIIGGVTIDDKSFNYLLLKAFLEGQVSDEVLSDSEFEAKIRRLAYTYKLTVEETRDCILKSMQLDKSLEYADFARYAAKYFEAKHKTTPKIATIQDNSYLESINDDAIKNVLYSIDGMSFTNVLESLTKGFAATSEVKMLDKLQASTGLPTDVINVMLLVINSDKDGNLPGYAYFEKVASQLLRAKVSNAYDAIKFFEKQRSEKHTKTDNTRVVPLPSWYKEYEESLKQSEDTNLEVTDQMREESLAFIKEFFKDE